MSYTRELLFLPLIVQGSLMIFDEFYFHRKRGLPLWEIIGHPLDTLSVLMPLAYAYFNDFTDHGAFIYIMMALFSCVFVIKDEFIHKDICSHGEMLLHALLFVFHPLVFLSIFILWRSGGGHLFYWEISFATVIGGQLTATLLFFIYQLSYWRNIDDRYKQRNLQRTQ